MSSTESNGYVLCIAGARPVNKRMAMYFESLGNAGTAVRVLALPRGHWIFDKSEQAAVVTRTGWLSADLGDVGGHRLASVLCFHWFVLPLAVMIGFVRRATVLYDEHDHYELNTLEGGGPSWKRTMSAWLVRVIHRMCLPWVTLVTCIHQHDQTLLRHLQRWQPRVMEVHNYPARVWHEKGLRRQPAGPLCFVYIGGIYREKGVAASADAFAKLPEAIRGRAELHFFGEGDSSLIDELSGRPGIVVHRAVTPAAFRDFVEQRRCCGLALLAGTPRYNLVGTNCTKLYEYLALGMPVIGTRVGEFPLQIEDGGVGLVISSDMNTAELTVAMQRMLLDPAMFAKFSHRAFERMSSPEMSWEQEWTRIAATGVIAGLRAA